MMCVPGGRFLHRDRGDVLCHADGLGGLRDERGTLREVHRLPRRIVEPRHVPAGHLAAGVVDLAPEQVRCPDGPRGAALPRGIGEHHGFFALLVLDEEVRGEAKEPAVEPPRDAEERAAQAELAGVPAGTKNGAEHVVPRPDHGRDVVALVLHPPAVVGPLGGQQGITDARAVQPGLVDAERGGEEHGAPDRAGHREGAAEVRGRLGLVFPPRIGETRTDPAVPGEGTGAGFRGAHRPSRFGAPLGGLALLVPGTDLPPVAGAGRKGAAGVRDLGCRFRGDVARVPDRDTAAPGEACVRAHHDAVCALPHAPPGGGAGLQLPGEPRPRGIDADGIREILTAKPYYPHHVPTIARPDGGGKGGVGALLASPARPGAYRRAPCVAWWLACIVLRPMKPRDHSALLAALAAEYEQHAPRSARLNKDAARHLVDGGSHAIRLLKPFPPRITAAHGSSVTDEDGNSILDFWQGHHANILGHNPPVVTGALAAGFAGGFGLQSGFTDALQVEVADLLCERVGAEKARFTTSGSLATMYATMLARSFTGRAGVMKVGGGWHGAQPWGLVGVDYHVDGTGPDPDGAQGGFGKVESRGLPGELSEQVVVTRFNDTRMLEESFSAHGSETACFIVEPFMGSAGCLPATRAFLDAARELTRKHGVLLIFDEVIAGFRFRAGSSAGLFGIQPDLGTYAKIIGGGMPVAAVAGRSDVMALAGRGGPVKFSGGTYSCHPASMLASRTMMKHLVSHEEEIYPRIAALGGRARRTVEEAFRGAGIAAKCTGDGTDALPAGSMGAVHFPFAPGAACSTGGDAQPVRV